ncbi:NADP-dependent oxidoreductase domain-containing protein [Mycena floridula]|nr:NADP-dependent oxidoreductase domain-containing protein [Mycena floridula]
MLYIPLNDGNKIPWIAFGTGTPDPNKDTSNAVRMAIDNGFSHLDTAQRYRNELSAGDAWKASGKPREELYMTTKLNLNLEPGETVRSSLVSSLEKLQTTYVDLFLVHSPRSAAMNNMTPVELWKEMEAVKAEGLARSIGVSNYFQEDLEAILKECTVAPAVNQIEFHPYVLKASEDILRVCRKHGIVIASYGSMSPVTWKSGGPVDAAVEAIIKRVGRSATASQILAKWVLAKGAVVVTTSNKEERIKEYIATEQVPDLTPHEVTAIDEAGSQDPTEPRVLAFYKKMDAAEQAK